MWDVEPFRRGNVSLVFFAPRGKDYQTLHDEDEFYFIVRGSGKLIIDGENFSFEAGDVFFVPKNVLHRFDRFTDDFATWAVFFSASRNPVTTVPGSDRIWETDGVF